MERGNEYNEESEEDAEVVKWAKHYSSFHHILLVGEGDFSFSLSLAKTFGSAINIVATSKDSRDALFKKYDKAEYNVMELERMGAIVIHQVDITQLKLHVGLRLKKFDRIVYNFPHAGFLGKEDNRRVIKIHRRLVRSFFQNASHLLRRFGEIHVTHKIYAPYSSWKLEKLASMCSLVLLECAEFSIKDYPGYENKRGSGSRCDEPFSLGKCSTFKFAFGQICRKKPGSITALPLVKPVMFSHNGYDKTAYIGYPEMRFPAVDRIPSSTPILPPAMTGIPRPMEHKFLVFPRVSLRVMEPSRSIYNSESSSRRMRLYPSHLEGIHMEPPRNTELTEA